MAKNMGSSQSIKNKDCAAQCNTHCNTKLNILSSNHEENEKLLQSQCDQKAALLQRQCKQDADLLQNETKKKVETFKKILSHVTLVNMSHKACYFIHIVTVADNLDITLKVKRGEKDDDTELLSLKYDMAGLYNSTTHFKQGEETVSWIPLKLDEYLINLKPQVTNDRYIVYMYNKNKGHSSLEENIREIDEDTYNAVEITKNTP